MHIYFSAFISLVFLGTWTGPAAYATEKPFDYVIKDALIFDGEARRPVQGDIAILGDRIVRVGEVSEAEGKEVIQAGGLIAAPGFIDVHTHSDFNPFVYTKLGNKVRQGVTTEVVGNCGMSAAPVQGPHEGEMPAVWRREGVEIPSKIEWTGFREYMEEAEFKGLETNFIGLIGHGNLRSSIMGMNPRKAAPEELEEMKDLLRKSLREGGFGISFGLAYLPGIFTPREELIELCKVAAQEKGMCAFHIRSESRQLLESIQEAIEIGKAAGAHVHISHLKASGEKNWPKITQVFQMIDRARAGGMDVTADAYPYTVGFAELAVILPDKIYQDPARITRFKDLRQRGRILRKLKKYYEQNPVSWGGIKIATVIQDKNFWMRGKSLAEISEVTKRMPIETLIDLLTEEEFKVSAFYFSQSESVNEQILSKPYVAIGSDSIADGSAMPHPRCYGTFPKFLSRCSQMEISQRNICWGNTIYQMTGLAAKTLGLRKRGRIGTGLYADIVLFDPATVRDKADYTTPKAAPEGIRWVFVNGKPAVREGKYQAVHSGLFVASER